MKVFDTMAVPLSDAFLIEASAGTGKTYTITSLFLRLVLKGSPVQSILVVTFTEAATAELRERIRSRLRAALTALDDGDSDDAFLSQVVKSATGQEKQQWRVKLLAALSGFDEAAIWTIHGFCLRVLQDHAFESGTFYDAELVTDQQSLFDQVAADFWSLEMATLPAPWNRYLQQKKITPAHLASLVNKTAGHSRLVVLPDSVETGLGVADFMRLFAGARDVWHRDKDDILNLLDTHPGVNKKSYTQKNRQRWARGVDEYLAPAEPTHFPEGTDIDKFSQARLLEFHGKIKKEVPEPRHPFFEVCDALCWYAETWLAHFQQRFLRFSRDRLERHKKEKGIFFFDDLIHHLEKALDGPGGRILADRIRSQYQAALIDEFQDTDQSQYRIFRAIFQNSSSPFFLIGDPKQSIYAFRGADIFAYLQASTDAKDRRGTLTVNWRSDPGLVQAVNTIFERAPGAFGFEAVRHHTITPSQGRRNAFLRGEKPVPAFEILVLKSSDIRQAFPISKAEAHEIIPDRVAAHISRLLAEASLEVEEQTKPLGPGDVAVLVRSNRQAGLVQVALRQYGIPSVLSGSDSVFESLEAVDLWRVLQAVASPGNDTRIRGALATSLFGFSAKDMDALRHDDVRWGQWVERFRDWHRLWQTDGFMSMMEKVFDFQPGPDGPPLLLGLLSRVGGERQVTNFKHLAELLHGVWMTEKLGMAGMMRWFDRQRTEGRQDSDAHELRLESDAAAVQLVTIHKSKGLEYPVVVAPYLWDGWLHAKNDKLLMFHEKAFDHRLCLNLGPNPEPCHRQAALWEEMAENMRLLYVALTRARHYCAVVWGPVKDFDTSALGYVFHGPGRVTDYVSAQAHLGALDLTAMENDLALLAAASNGSISVSPLTDEAGVPFQPREDVQSHLFCRARRRVLRRQWRFESYSHLVSQVESKGPVDEFDRDRVLKQSISEEIHELIGFGASPLIPLVNFEQGATAGSFFHSIYEHIDFTLPNSDELASVVEEKLPAFGFDAGLWRDSVRQAVSNTLTCALDAGDPFLCLNRIPRDQRLNELEFVFPVAKTKAAGPGSVTPAHLAEIIARHGGPGIPKGYAAKIERLSFPPFQGFLKGFIDLVFCHQGRWHIVDYKSNYLGPSYEDYATAKILSAMADHHYFLQYLFYVTALHRYLSCRIEGYDYESHMGKVFYLFIRGMSPKAAPGFGVFQDRPSRALIEGLSGLFGDE